jgi:hypothetical protein
MELDFKGRIRSQISVALNSFPLHAENAYFYKNLLQKSLKEVVHLRDIGIDG